MKVDRLVGPKIFRTGSKIEVLESLVDNVFNNLILDCRGQEVETKDASGRLDCRSRLLSIACGWLCSFVGRRRSDDSGLCALPAALCVR